jgi:hypothetical protein
MKLFLSIAAVLALSVQPVWADSNPESVLKNTLIVGASVSYGYDPVTHGTQPDPATILATRFNDQSGIIKHAISGATSEKVLPEVTADDLAKASISIGVDLFFWDSLLSGSACDSAVARVQSLAKTMQMKNAPWILGRVPPLAFEQDCLKSINDAIDTACSQDHNCRLVDFEKVIHDIQAQNGMMIHGHFYSPSELQPDGLHLSAVASQWVADMLEDAVRMNANPYLVFGSERATH